MPLILWLAFYLLSNTNQLEASINLIPPLPAMKLARKILRRASSKSNSGKLVYRCAAPEVERVSQVFKAEVVYPSDFNEVEFQEYDPTPYDGGYNLALTYGEPLPPAGAICYPRSAWDPNSKNLEEFSYGSVMAPYGLEQVHVEHEKPLNGSGLTGSYEEDKPRNDSGWALSYEEERPSYDGNGNWPCNPVPSHGDDFWGGDIFSYGNGYGNGYGCNDYEKPMVPYQREEERCGYGMSESEPGYNSQSNCMEPYEDLFGGWLWSSRDDGDSYTRHDADKPSNGNSWNGTADYFFGFSYPYGESRDDNHSYGYPTYGYEKHSHEQPNHVLVEYREPSWTPEPSYYQAYQEEVHTQTEYSDDSYRESGVEFYYHNHM